MDCLYQLFTVVSSTFAMFREPITIELDATCLDIINAIKGLMSQL